MFFLHRYYVFCFDNVIVKMKFAVVSGTVTANDQRAFIKIDIVRGVNMAEVHNALSEVCGEFRP